MRGDKAFDMKRCPLCTCLERPGRLRDEKFHLIDRALLGAAREEAESCLVRQRDERLRNQRVSSGPRVTVRSIAGI